MKRGDLNKRVRKSNYVQYEVNENLLYRFSPR